MTQGCATRSPSLQPRASSRETLRKWRPERIQFSQYGKDPKNCLRYSPGYLVSCCLLVLAFARQRVRWSRSAQFHCRCDRNDPKNGLRCSPKMANTAGAGASSSSSSSSGSSSSKNAGEVRQRRSLKSFLSAITVSALFVVLVVLWLRYRWNAFYESAVACAFTQLDMDSNGVIDNKELYAGVLLIYLRLKGLVRLKVPTHKSVMQLLQVTDSDQSGLLDADEFKHTMDLLSGQLLARALVQVVLILSCPLLASVIVKSVASAIQNKKSDIKAAGTRCKAMLQKVFLGRVLLTMVIPVGRKVKNTWKNLPASFPATMVTVIMVHLINAWLYLIDDGLVWWHGKKWI